jgi:hypothetical protein
MFYLSCERVQLPIKNFLLAEVPLEKIETEEVQIKNFFGGLRARYTIV